MKYVKKKIKVKWSLIRKVLYEGFHSICLLLGSTDMHAYHYSCTVFVPENHQNQ